MPDTLISSRRRMPLPEFRIARSVDPQKNRSSLREGLNELVEEGLTLIK